MDSITKFEELVLDSLKHDEQMELWKNNEDAMERRRTIIEANGNTAIHYNLDESPYIHYNLKTSTDSEISDNTSTTPNLEKFTYIKTVSDQVELEEDKSPDFKIVTDSIADLLKYKNLKYGNAALEPMQIFEGKSKVGQRLDDKLARVKNGKDLKKNDIADLIGYLTLVCIENNWSNFDEFKD